MFDVMDFSDLLYMASSYDQRKISRDEVNGFTISTVYTLDCGHETAVSHEEFDNGDWIIVEYHSNATEAAENHIKWYNKLNNEYVTELKSVQDNETYKRNK